MFGVAITAMVLHCMCTHSSQRAHVGTPHPPHMNLVVVSHPWQLYASFGEHAGSAHVISPSL